MVGLLRVDMYSVWYSCLAAHRLLPTHFGHLGQRSDINRLRTSKANVRVGPSQTLVLTSDPT